MTDYVKCKNCGGKIDGHPRKCPYCWVLDPVPNEGGAAVYIGSVLAGALFLIFVNAVMIDDKAPNPVDKNVEILAEKQKEREQRERGFHCLSSWDGANEDVIQHLKRQLKDPSSFEHIETRIAPINERGAHALIMSYRAKNSFGAYDAGTVVASLRNWNCKIETISIN